MTEEKKCDPTKGEQCCWGTECPGGCCPEYDWFCCEDPMYCAATPEGCPPDNQIKHP